MKNKLIRLIGILSAFLLSILGLTGCERPYNVAMYGVPPTLEEQELYGIPSSNQETEKIDEELLNNESVQDSDIPSES